jgi:two-component system response regulator RpfG
MQVRASAGIRAQAGAQNDKPPAGIGEFMGTAILMVGGSESDHRVLRDAAATPEDRVSFLALTCATEALDWAIHHQPDLVVVDARHPYLDVVAFARLFRHTVACADIPLLLVAAHNDRTTCHRAFATGASDFVQAPLDVWECRLRIHQLLTMAAQRRVIRQQARWLEHGDVTRSDEMQAREKETLLRLARAGEFRDQNTGAHVLRLAKLSRYTAERLGLPRDECEVIELAAPMHDIGKIGVPDSLLRKPGPLTTEERKVMELHTVIGYEILKDSRSIYLQRGAQIALSHHERFDGSGYPHGLEGDDIPVAARIVTVADTFDALTSTRPYKSAWPLANAVAYLREQRGKHFDPDCVDAFLSWAAEAVNIRSGAGKASGMWHSAPDLPASPILEKVSASR